MHFPMILFCLIKLILDGNRNIHVFMLNLAELIFFLLFQQSEGIDENIRSLENILQCIFYLHSYEQLAYNTLLNYKI